MVYKKIIDGIPSLSSLLLAGIVLGGGCEKKGSGSAATATVAAGSEDPAYKFSPELSKARWEAWNFMYGKMYFSYNYFLTNKEPLTRLESGAYIQTRRSSANAIKSALKERAKAIKERFSVVSSGMTLGKVGTSLGAWEKGPFKETHLANYGSAIEQIICVYNKFHSIFHELSDVYKGIQEDRYNVNFQWKAKEADLDIFYGNHIRGKFDAETRISVPKRADTDTLLYEQTKDLLPFLAAKNERSDVANILEQQLGELLLYQEGSNSNVGNVGKAWLDEVHVTRKIDSEQYEFRVFSLKRGACGSREMDFKTLLFLLFQGSLDQGKNKKVTEGIFGWVNKQSGEGENGGKLKSNPTEFKNLVDTIASEAKFAELLAQKIKSKDLPLYVLDMQKQMQTLNELKDKYLHNALNEQDELYPGSNVQNPAEMDYKNFTVDMIRTLASPFPNIKCDGKTIDEVLTEIVEQGGQDGTLYNNSDQLFSRRFAVEIKNSKVLINKLKSESSEVTRSVFPELSNLLDAPRIREGVLCEIDINGTHKLTSLGNSFKLSVIRLNDALKQERGDLLSRTYAQMEGDILGFEVEPIRKWAEETYKLLKCFLALPGKLGDVFAKNEGSGTVNYSEEIGIGDLDLDDDAVIQRLDSIRLAYLKTKKEKAEGKAEEPAASGA